MPVGILSEMTWTQVAALDPSTVLAVLPVGATEAHGPHLPTGTDDIIARSMAREGAERLSARGFQVVVLPTLSYTTAGFARGFPGTVSISEETARDVMVDIGRSLRRHGITRLAVANAHLDPGHLAAVHGAVARLAREGLEMIFPDLTRKPWGSRLTREFRTGACHAGRYESSVVLARRPGLVADDVRRALPPNPSSLSAAIREGKSSFEEAGGRDAYFGWPADASVEEGEEVVRILASILEDAVLEAVGFPGDP